MVLKAPLFIVILQLSLVVRKPTFCIYAKTKTQISAQLISAFVFATKISFTIPLLSKSEISSLYPSSVAVQPCLCGTWSETPKTGFLTTRLKLLSNSYLFTSVYLMILKSHTNIEIATICQLHTKSIIKQFSRKLNLLLFDRETLLFADFD